MCYFLKHRLFKLFFFYVIQGKKFKFSRLGCLNLFKLRFLVVDFFITTLFFLLFKLKLKYLDNNSVFFTKYSTRI